MKIKHASLSTVHELEKEGDNKKKWLQTRTARSRKIKKDPNEPVNMDSFFYGQHKKKKLQVKLKGEK
jgi:hypothetical protein